MTKLLMVKCDVNDADYVHNIEEIDDTDLEIIKSVVAKISKFRPYKSKYTHHHNFPQDPRTDMGEKTIQQLYDFTPEENNVVCNYFGYGFDGMPAHTLHTVQIIEIKEELFKLDRSIIYGK